MARKYTLTHKNFAKIHCFKRTLKGILPYGTLSHNFLINCNTLSHNFLINCNTLSHNFLINCNTLSLDFSQKRTPCRISFNLKDTLLSGLSRQVIYGSTPPPQGFDDILRSRKERKTFRPNFHRKFYLLFLWLILIEIVL